MRLACPRRLTEAGEPWAERTIPIRFAAEQGGGEQRPAARRTILNRRIRRHRPSAPCWSRAAGIAARDDAAPAAAAARMDRGRAWIAAPPDRGRRRPWGAGP